MKKFLSVLLIIALTISVVVGCGKTKKNYDSAETNVLIFQFKVEIEKALQELVRSYYEKTGVKVEVQTVGGGNDYGAALRALVNGGTEPAIFNVGGPQDIVDLKDRLLDISDSKIAKQAFPALLSAATLDGKVVGVPYNQEGYGFIYNKAIFQKAGINPEDIKSFAKLEEVVKTLDSKKADLGIDAVFTLPGKETWVTGLHLLNTAFVGEFASVMDAFNAKTIKFNYNESFKKLYDLQANYAYQKNNINSIDYATQVGQTFAMGKVAMIQQGNWVFNDVKEVDVELAKNIGFLPIPVEGFKEDSIPVGVPMYWSVNNKVNKDTQKQALAFLEWLYTSEEGQDAVVNKFGFIPAYKGFKKLPADPLAKDILKYSEEGRTMQWVFMGFPSNWGMENFAAEALQKYQAGQMNWDQVVKHAIDTWAEARK